MTASTQTCPDLFVVKNQNIKERGMERVSGLKKERAGFARLNGERERGHAGCDLVVGEDLVRD